jgi:hypothetical protein
MNVYEVTKGTEQDTIIYPCLMQVREGVCGEGSVYLSWGEGKCVCLLGVHGDEAGTVVEGMNMKPFYPYTGTIQLSN